MVLDETMSLLPRIKNQFLYYINLTNLIELKRKNSETRIFTL
jgi:hypothetical protein